ncbi:Na+/H+ antiporter subunit A [Corynebacterium sp. 11A]|uniref:Na+/H+ antiporter subunit A n=1 Tax=Corynebacterium sp. 11A TaxID=2080510 RepID=UPI00124D8361|nr:Na+/H+ antiporter subunit A [Corynebacterium sp. 11A]
MLILLLCLIAASLLTPALLRVLGRPAFGVVALVPAAGFWWVLTTFFTTPEPTTRTAEIPWMSGAHLDLDFRLDSLSALFALIILGVGALVLLYCWGYFNANPRRLATFGGCMVAFCMAMYGLVISDNLLLMYVFWEITSVLSFLLVGYYGERASSRRSAGQALMVTSLGGLAMLVGIVVFGTRSGQWTLSGLVSHGIGPDAPWMGAAVALVLAGALSKSAIAPAHFWLPGAMAAPTPVSAYLHSAAMVKAGIYLVARLSPTLNGITAWHLIVLPLGIFTMLLGGWMALRQKDLKLILAYGTVSQLGFIITVMGVGAKAALIAGLALMLAHSMFKATLFMVVGAIDHCTGTRNKNKLSGLGRKKPGLALIAALAGASMAGLPPFFGFVAKEAVFETLLHEPLLVGLPGQATLLGLVVGSVLTVAYTLYFFHAAFFRKRPDHPSGGGISPAVATMDTLSFTQWAPPLVLALAGLFFGLRPELLDQAISIHAGTVYDDAEMRAVAPSGELALWHGFGIPLLLTAVIIAAGAIMHWQRKTLERFHFDKPALGSADAAYDSTLDTLRRLSLRITANTQRGSLPINEAVILLTFCVLPMVAILLGERTNVRMTLWDTPVQGVLALIIIVVAIATTRMDNRLSAVVLLGVTGYGLALIFATYGAPDLALTQLLVETVSMVVFMLVLRKLPAETSARTRTGYLRGRAWLAAAVGMTTVVLGVFAMNARSVAPISEAIPALAKDIAHGANAVNVLLVDIRAWDTLGEISVIVIVATGVASLVYRTRSFSRVSRRPVLHESTFGGQWLSAPSAHERERNRALVVEAATRLSFPAMIVLSVFFFFAGHNAPGGGFAGGLVAGLAFALRYLAGGPEELEQTMPVDPGKIIGSGLGLASISAVAPLLLGDAPLRSYVLDLHVPLIGEMHLVSPLIFDLGVYLIVVGLVLYILQSLGGQLDRDERSRRRKAVKKETARKEMARHGS